MELHSLNVTISDAAKLELRRKVLTHNYEHRKKIDDAISEKQVVMKKSTRMKLKIAEKKRDKHDAKIIDLKLSNESE